MSYGEGNDREEENGLDLLTAMLDSGATEKQTATKSKRKRGSVDERRNSGVVKRRKVVGNEETKSAESADNEMSQMKRMCPLVSSCPMRLLLVFDSLSVRMQEMEKEMMRLRQEVKRASEVKQSGSPTQKPPGPAPKPPSSRTEAMKLSRVGEKRRVARQPMANQGKTSSQKDSGPAGGEIIRGMDMHRGVADDIIRQRQEDEQSNVITEKYSKLRIK